MLEILLLKQRRIEKCQAERREKGIKWQRINVKNVCARTGIKRRNKTSDPLL
jgi:hypothetical protein